jgi:hypothetical protein
MLSTHVETFPESNQGIHWPMHEPQVIRLQVKLISFTLASSTRQQHTSTIKRLRFEMLAIA